MQLIIFSILELRDIGLIPASFMDHGSVQQWKNCSMCPFACVHDMWRLLMIWGLYNVMLRQDQHSMSILHHHTSPLHQRMPRQCQHIPQQCHRHHSSLVICRCHMQLAVFGRVWHARMRIRRRGHRVKCAVSQTDTEQVAAVLTVNGFYHLANNTAYTSQRDGRCPQDWPFL